MPSGRRAAARAKACESVMMSDGGAARAASAPSMPSGVQQRAVQPLSSSSRIVCTWGWIRRPLGASASWGMTRSTVSPAAASPAVISRGVSSGNARTRASRSSARPLPCVADTATGRRPQRFPMRAAAASGSDSRSALDSTPTTGMLRSRRCPSHASVAAWGASSSSSPAMSVRSSVRRAVAMRRAPSSSCASSKPGVSVSTQAPSPRSSMAFDTGSVVVPGRSETTEICWPVRALMRVDLPLLHRPKKAMCRRSDWGVRSFMMAVFLCAARAGAVCV